METPKHPNHVLASSKGGIRQSQLEYYCSDCNDYGIGNRFLQFHINDKLCEGRGIKNKKSLKRKGYQKR
jgi:hypothetical protein